MNEEEPQRHPGSEALAWWNATIKNADGYAPLSNLVEDLRVKTGVRGVAFIRRLATPEWKKEHGFRLCFHRYKPNRIKLESLIVMGLVCRHHP